MSIINLLTKLKDEVDSEFLSNILPYWYKNSMDDVNGGFFGRIDHNNHPVEDADRGGILVARILWSFSAAYKQFPLPEIEELAHRAYHYLSDYLIDTDHGGVFWTVDHEGRVSDDRKHVYVQAFAIYGLSEYFSSFGVEAAIKKAEVIYKIVEEFCIDPEYGGYFEAYSRDWKLIDDVRLSDKDENEPKSMNTHLHVLEGYTNLYRYMPDENLRGRIEELLAIFDQHIFNDSKTSMTCFFDTNWDPKSDLISCGHDIEASWLCLEAAQVIESTHWIEKFSETALKVSYTVNKETDPDGGLINERTPFSESDTDKDWWPQAEALVGHLNAFGISGRSEFLKAALNSWDFIKAFIIDDIGGEWFEKVNRNGKPYDELDKVRLWKAPYHNTRAMLEVSRRVVALLKKPVIISHEVNVEKSG